MIVSKWVPLPTKPPFQTSLVVERHIFQMGLFYGSASPGNLSVELKQMEEGVAIFDPVIHVFCCGDSQTQVRQ